MSGEEGSLREIWTALSLITRRLDELAGAVGRLAASGAAPSQPGEPLDEATRRRLAGLESLLAIGQGMTREEALLLAVDRVVHRVGADCAAVFLPGPRGELTTAVHRGFAQRAPVIHGAGGIIGRALADGESIRGGPADQGGDPLMREHALGSALAVPVPVPGGSPIGVLFAGRRRPVELDAGALKVMTLLADRLGLVLAPRAATRPEPARFVDLAADLDLERTATAVARQAVRLSGAPAAAVLLREEHGWAVGGAVGVPAGAQPLVAEAGALGAALGSRNPWVPAAGEAGERDEPLAAVLGAPLRLVVPLVTGDQVVAILAVGGPQPVPLPTVAPLLPAAAAAIRNARLYTTTAAALAELRGAPEPGPLPPPARDVGGLLAVVLGRLGAIRERVGHADITREVDVAEEAAWRAAEAVRGVLGFAPGHRASALVPLDVASVIRAAVEQAQQRWADRETRPPSVRVSLEPLPPIRGSADDLAEALDHLLENAAEALPEGGPVAVRARWDGGPQVEIVVEDLGLGMDDTVRAHALEPFFSTKGPRRLGLGLPVTQAIVARHRGELEIASAPGLGTTVRLSLPTVAAGRRVSVGAPVRGARVLVVAEEASARDGLTAALGRDGHAILTAGNGSEALAIVQQQAVDAVVMDLVASHAVALEAARAVGHLRPGTPVILVTASAGGLDAVRLEESGVAAVLEKPVNVAEIGAALAAALARRRAGHR